MATTGNIAKAVHTHAISAITGLQSALDSLTTALSGKADTEDLADVATSGSYADLTDTPTIPDSPDDIGAAAASHTHTASQISDSTTTGRSVLTAASASAARTAIGAGTSSFNGAYSSLTGTPSFADVATSGSYTDLSDTPDLDGKMDQSVATGHEARFRGVYATVDDLDGLSDAQDGDWAIVPVTA